MILLIGIVLAAIVFILVSQFSSGMNIKKRMTVSLIPLVLAMLVSCVKIVPLGHSAVVTTFGKMEDRVLLSGFNMVAPWQSTITVDNRTQKQQITTQAFSSDIQQVDALVTVNFRVTPESEQELLLAVGRDFVDTILTPRTMESLKSVFSGYPAEALVENRAVLSDQITALLNENVAEYGITVEGIAIENLDFSDAFTDAVEAKQVATQKKLEAETKQSQLTLEEKAAAERKLIATQAEADAKIIAAEAEAKANKALAESITPELIDLKEAEARLKHGWVTVQGGTTTTATIANPPVRTIINDNTSNTD